MKKENSQKKREEVEGKHISWAKRKFSLVKTVCSHRFPFSLLSPDTTPRTILFTIPKCSKFNKEGYATLSWILVSLAEKTFLLKISRTTNIDFFFSDSFNRLEESTQKNGVESSAIGRTHQDGLHPRTI